MIEDFAYIHIIIVDELPKHRRAGEEGRELPCSRIRPAVNKCANDADVVEVLDALALQEGLVRSH